MGNKTRAFLKNSNTDFNNILDSIVVLESAQGAVTQATNHTNGVTINATSGVITLDELTLVDKTFFSFHGNKIFFYFNLIYISLIFFLKRKEL